MAILEVDGELLTDSARARGNRSANDFIDYCNVWSSELYLQLSDILKTRVENSGIEFRNVRLWGIAEGAKNFIIDSMLMEIALGHTTEVCQEGEGGEQQMRRRKSAKSTAGRVRQRHTKAQSSRRQNPRPAASR